MSEYFGRLGQDYRVRLGSESIGGVGGGGATDGGPAEPLGGQRLGRSDPSFGSQFRGAGYLGDA